MEKRMIKNSAGQDIATVVHFAKEVKGLAVLCPGYLDTKDYAHLVNLAEALSGAGYDAVRFDPTGTWESGGTIAEYKPTQYLADIGSVIDCMVANKAYPQVILCGHSRGGTLSVFYAAHDPRISFVAAIMSNAVSGRPDDKWKTTGIRFSTRDIPGKIGSVKEFRVPYHYKEDLDRYDVNGAVSRLKIPLLFMAGERDDKITPEKVRVFYERANGQKSFFIVPGAVHDYRRNPQWIATVNEKILEKVKKLG
jgi:pimeloyl-ACP methyl ester carboxylesterase